MLMNICNKKFKRFLPLDLPRSLATSSLRHFKGLNYYLM